MTGTERTIEDATMIDRLTTHRIATWYRRKILKRERYIGFDPGRFGGDKSVWTLIEIHKPTGVVTILETGFDSFRVNSGTTLRAVGAGLIRME
jgi:hypothetical protein